MKRRVEMVCHANHEAAVYGLTVNPHAKGAPCAACDASTDDGLNHPDHGIATMPGEDMREGTPPWRVGEDTSPGPNVSARWYVMAGSRLIAAHLTHDEAVRIVRAVNAHDALVAALSELVAEADEHPGWEGHPHANSVGFQMAREALAALRAAGEGV